LLEIAAANLKAKSDDMYQAVVAMIHEATDDELPRKKTKDRVTLTCPPDKKPGDSILFSNPHVPGQRLKVKIPKNTPPGGNFKVTVPVAVAPDDEEEMKDHNKFSREFYDTLDSYSRAYDDWCDAEQDARRAAGDKEYAAHVEKRGKFDYLVEEFPKDLKTEIDKTYLQKILRRARQNRHKVSLRSGAALSTVNIYLLRSRR
jgi:hypothetical protein